jgi:hypothetical protein
MRAFVLFLVLVNLVLFAWQQGGLRGPGGDGRESQRIARQIAPEALRLLTSDQVASLRGASQPGGELGSAAACVELGDFDDASLPRVQDRLAQLSLGERLRARRVRAQAWYVVYLPPAASSADAERQALDLRSRGIQDLVVMGPNTSMPNAIQLGSFRDPELAQRRQAELAERGVRDVQVAARAAGAESTRFEITDVDPALSQRLAQIQKEFPQSRLGSCGN